MFARSYLKRDYNVWEGHQSSITFQHLEYDDSTPKDWNVKHIPDVKWAKCQAQVLSEASTSLSGDHRMAAI